MRRFQVVQSRVSDRCPCAREAKRRCPSSAPRISPDACALFSLSPGERAGGEGERSSLQYFRNLARGRASKILRLCFWPQVAEADPGEDRPARVDFYDPEKQPHPPINPPTAVQFTGQQRRDRRREIESVAGLEKHFDERARIKTFHHLPVKLHRSIDTPLIGAERFLPIAPPRQ